MNAYELTDPLAENTNNTFIVLGAYFIAFASCTITGKVDSSREWGTVQHTPHLGWFHVALSKMPME